jgi:hypothetical protein
VLLPFVAAQQACVVVVLVVVARLILSLLALFPFHYRSAMIIAHVCE